MPKMWYRMVGVLLLVLLLAGCSGGSGAPDAEWTVSISGAVGNPLELSYADLAKMDQVPLDDVLMQKSQGENTVDSWEGVALAPLLAKANISTQATGITAIAADGYAIQMAMADLEGTIIALKLNDAWIAEDKDHGPLRIVVPLKPANHWLFQLTDIVVEEAAIASPTPYPTKEPTPESLASKGVPENAALVISGKVTAEVGWTLDEFMAMEMADVKTEHPKTGEAMELKGAKLAALLQAVGADPAGTAVLTADDGFESEVAMADITACSDCIIYQDGDMLRLAMPGMSTKAWVKGLVKIVIK